MAKVHEQLAALSEIRSIVEKHFPEEAYYIAQRLQEEIPLELYQEIAFDEERHVYVLRDLLFCKVCGTTDSLIEIPIVSGSFHICRKCQRTIAKASTIAQE